MPIDHSLDWNLLDSPDPREIWKKVRSHPNLQQIVFRGEPLNEMLRREDPEGGKLSFVPFARMYKRSVEFAWLSAAALLGQPSWCPSNFFTVERRPNEVTLTLSRAAIENISSLSEADAWRAAVIPQVLAGPVYNFREAKLPFEIALGDDDLRTLEEQNPDRTMFCVKCVDFVRATKTASSTDRARYDALEELKTYGFDFSKVRTKIRYKAEAGPPDNDEAGGATAIATYLCFNRFTDEDESGLHLAIERQDHSRGRGKSAATLLSSVWWYNHHNREACPYSPHACPNVHFEDVDMKDWFQFSIAPYVEVWRKELQEDRETNLDHLILIAAGVDFDTAVLGFFLAIGLKLGRNIPNNEVTKTKLGEFLASVRAHTGHVRFLMISNLASEISELYRSVSEVRRGHGEMLELLNRSVENLRSGMLDVLDDARRITRVVQGPQMEPFVKSSEVARYFEPTPSGIPGVKIGDRRYKISHNADYATLHEQCAIFSAIVLTIFGPGAKDGVSKSSTRNEVFGKESTPLGLFKAASGLLNRRSGPDGELSKLLSELTGVDETVSKMIDDKLSSGEAKSEESLTSALDRIKSVLYTPAKEDAAHYPWDPLFLVAFGGVGSAAARTVIISEAGMPNKKFGTFAEALASPMVKGGGKFLQDLRLPVPRYNMLLSFLASLLAYADTDPAAKSEAQREFLISRASLGWAIEFTFPVIESACELSRQMSQCHKIGNWPTYTGDLYGPFLAWAAECGPERRTAEVPVDPGNPSTLFCVVHRATRTTISQTASRLRITFEPHKDERLR